MSISRHSSTLRFPDSKVWPSTYASSSARVHTGSDPESESSGASFDVTAEIAFAPFLRNPPTCELRRVFFLDGGGLSAEHVDAGFEDVSVVLRYSSDPL